MSSSEVNCLELPTVPLLFPSCSSPPVLFLALLMLQDELTDLFHGAGRGAHVDHQVVIDLLRGRVLRRPSSR